MIAVDAVGAHENQIEFSQASDSEIQLQNLEIATPTGCAKLDQAHVEIAQGERVLIAGESGAGKTILFRAIAGLWRWGTGQITLPSAHEVMFMPRQPYVPLGTLRAALVYPSTRVGLSRNHPGLVLYPISVPMALAEQRKPAERKSFTTRPQRSRRLKLVDRRSRPIYEINCKSMLGVPRERTVNKNGIPTGAVPCGRQARPRIRTRKRK